MLELEIRQHLIQYLTRKISLGEFQQWFVPNTWDIHLSNEQGAIALTYEIEHRLAEHSSEHLPEAQLRRELTELLSYATIRLGNVSATTVQTSSRWQQIAIWQQFKFAEAGDQSRSSGTLSVVALS